MNDKFIDELFEEAIPEPDLNARKIAINSAVSEFSQKNSQGNTNSARPIDKQGSTPLDNSNSIGSFIMSIFKNPKSTPVFATLAVAFVAGSIVTMMPDTHETITDDVISTVPKSVVTEQLEAKVKSEEPTATPLIESRIVAKDDTNELIAEAELDYGVISSARKQKAQHNSVADVNEKIKISKEQLVSVERQAPAASAELTSLIPSLADLSNTKSAASSSDNVNLAAAIATKTPGLTRQSNLPGLIRAQASLPDRPAPGTEQRPDLNEDYAKHKENTIKLASDEPVSTFSADVDTASYSLVRNQLLRGYLPSPMAVRTEEMINYFNYNYPLPDSKARPFSSSINVFDSPWNTNKKLIHIGIKGYDIAKTEQPDSNIVFLLDVSGSMNNQNKLPLVKNSISLLLDTLKPSDTVSIVVYAGAAGTVLEPTKAKKKTKILSALQNLNAGGSTAGGQGIELAYQLAEQNFDKAAVNRIILATDGDFNVGQKSNDALKTLVERKRNKGIFLSVLGFGRNNYQDDMMQTLAQNGNGVAAYIDSLSEAKKVLVDEATSTLFTIAKDVKLQVEFNPAAVSEYRLIGYETRALNREDFNNDKVDAGDIGAGHTVTAIYEITPTGAKSASIDAPRYAANKKDDSSISKDQNEYGFLKIRFKLPKESKSALIEQPIHIADTKPTSDVLFSTAAAGFAQLLKGGKYTGELSYDDIAKLAQANKGEDKFGYRSEFIQLVSMAKIAKN